MLEKGVRYRSVLPLEAQSLKKGGDRMKEQMSRREFVQFAAERIAWIGAIPSTLATFDVLRINNESREQTVFPACSAEVCPEENRQAALAVVKKTLTSNRVKLDIGVVSLVAIAARIALQNSPTEAK